MDYGRIVTRAFEITWKYRALWLFGFLLALMGEGASITPFNYDFNSRDFTNQSIAPGAIPGMPAIPWNMIVVGAGVVVCVILIWAVLAIIVRLISRGAVIGLVNELETSQTTPTVRHGFDLGTDHFGPLLGIALWINVPLTIVSLVLLLLGAAPLIASIIAVIQAGRSDSSLVGLGITGLLGSIALLCCVVLLLVIVKFVIYPFYQFFIRACVIGQRSATDSIREGYRLVRANLGSVAILYILTIVLNFAFGVVVLLLGLIFAGIALLPAFAIGMASQSATFGVITGIVIGLVLLLVWLLIFGVYIVFESTIWTEGYLALTAPKPVTAVVSATENP